MSPRHRKAMAAALAAALGLGAPVWAHSPRDHRPRAPLMDLEVLVPPALYGTITGGARDPRLAIDRFGNRLAVAGTSLPAGTPDSRSRAQVRNAPWTWVSFDDGTSWENLDLLPRAAETVAPQPDSYGVASSGATTYVALGTPTGAIVTVITATKRGRLTVGTPVPVLLPRMPGSTFEVAAGPRGLHLLMSGPAEQRLFTVTASTSTETATLPEGTACDLAAGAGEVLVACLDTGRVTLTHIRRVGAAVGLVTRVLGASDTRGGDSGAPSVDASPDGSAAVLSGARLWWVSKRGATGPQDLHSEPGAYRSTTLSVSHRNRIAVAGYRRTAHGEWHVVVTMLTPGQRPVWSDFAYHDPVVPIGTVNPPSARVTLDTDERGRLQLLWTTGEVSSQELGRPVLHNVWAVRSVTS